MQSGSTLQLQAFNPDQTAPIVVGSAPVPSRQRNGFVRLELNDDWQLERRVYQGRTLSHLYFSNPDPIQLLMARAIRQARGSSMAKLGRSLILIKAHVLLGFCEFHCICGSHAIRAVCASPRV